MKTLFLSIGVILCNAHSLETLPWEEYILIPFSALCLSVIAGIMSGLTVGLMSIDEFDLKMKLEVGTELEKYHARRILPILSNHHLLLVTLLLSNALALETMPLALNHILGGIPSVIISAFLTLFISEVIPQALCISHYQIAIASAFAPLVRLLIFILYPISYFIAKGLDKIVGKHSIKMFSSKELSTFFILQLNGTEAGAHFNEYQINIINKAINLKNLKVADICIPIEKVFFLISDVELTESKFNCIINDK